MKKLFTLSLSALALTLSLQANDELSDIEKLADKKCSECHLIGKLSAEKLKKISAPPAWGIAKKVKLNYKNREDGIRFIMDYALNPSEDKMLFPHQTIERFGHMPSLKGKITDEELRAIAEFILR